MTNIRNLLLNYPKGAELDCLMFENVTFEGIDYENDAYPIKIRYAKDKTISLTKYGQYTDDEKAKCVIYPKGKVTWDGFDIQPNPGDIVVSKNGGCFIYKGCDELYYHSYCALMGDGYLLTEPNDRWVSVRGELRHATPTEERNLLYHISKNGYKWFADTHTLVNLSDWYKNGDIVVISDTYTWVCYLKSFKDGKVLVHASVCLDDSVRHLNNTNEYLCDIIDVAEISVADKEEKEILLEATREKGYHWNGNELVKACDTPKKFDINTLKPFESRVLVRDYKTQRWKVAFWGYKIKNGEYSTTYGLNKYCIPYEGNEHLLGKIDDCGDYYKTW